MRELVGALQEVSDREERRREKEMRDKMNQELSEKTQELRGQVADVQASMDAMIAEVKLISY